LTATPAAKATAGRVNAKGGRKLDQALKAFAQWLGATPISVTLQSATWVIPSVQTVHILAIAVVIGSVGFLDLRVLGVGLRSLDIGTVRRQSLPRTWAALTILLATGTVLVVAEPERSVANLTFQVKMALLLVAIGLTLWLSRDLKRLAADERPGAGARAVAGVSLATWVAIIFAGRWIAYTFL